SSRVKYSLASSLAEFQMGCKQKPVGRTRSRCNVGPAPIVAAQLVGSNCSHRLATEPSATLYTATLPLASGLHRVCVTTDRNAHFPVTLHSNSPIFRGNRPNVSAHCECRWQS